MDEEARTAVRAVADDLWTSIRIDYPKAVIYPMWPSRRTPPLPRSERNVIDEGDIWS